MATASLVLGIVTIVLAFIPFLNTICPITGILAIIFGIINLCKDKENSKKFSKPVVGILLSTLAVSISYVIMMIYGIVGYTIFNFNNILDIGYENTYKYIINNDGVNKYENKYKDAYIQKNDRKR